MDERLNDLLDKLADQEIAWLPASRESTNKSTTVAETEQALDRASLLWGETELTTKFRTLLKERGISIYDHTKEHHFTGSSIVLEPVSRRVLMTFHPWYQIWLQLGGHDEGERNPVAVSAREGWEESGIKNLWICDWPVRIDPHPAYKCKAVKGHHNNWHYDICYMMIAGDDKFYITDESDDMRWFGIEEIKELVHKGKAQQRGLEMAQNSLVLYDALLELNKLPDGTHKTRAEPI